MDLLRHGARFLLGAALLFTGTAHLTFAREDFRAQVPPWFPLDTDMTVLASGVVELALGVLLLLGQRRWVGLLVALFFVAIFPGNVAQYVEGRDAFGLDTDQGRFIRLFFQPVLILWALWVGGWFSRRREVSAS